MNKYAPASGTMKISAAMTSRMMDYPWPGNLRELENFIRRLVILGDESMMLGEKLGEDESRKPTVQRSPPATPPGAGLRDMKREAERKAIQAALEHTQWRRKEAAKILNISYKALLYKMRDLQMDVA